MIISAKVKTTLRLIHKYIGFIFSLFIIQLTVTGIMLLYPKFFGLDNTFVSNDLILEKYNMLRPEDVRILGNKNDKILFLDNSLYFNKTLIDNFQKKVVNAIYIRESNSLLVFFEKQISFYKLKVDANLVDILDVNELSLNNKVVKVGINNKDDIYINTETKNYNLNNKKLIVTNEMPEIEWLEESKKNNELAKDYLEIHQGKGVPLHRIITELHNGKIMGSFLSYILFLTSLSLLFLIISSFFFGINIKKDKK